MDNQIGGFTPLEKEEFEYQAGLRAESPKGDLPSLFSVGEEITIKNSNFKVSHVDNDGKGSGRLILKLLPRKN